MKIFRNLILLWSSVVLTMCNTGTTPNTQENQLGNENETTDSATNIDYVLISPNEIFEYIFFEELEPNPAFVNPHANAKKYITTSKMALNLGVYTTDFIYLNLCSDKTQVLEYYKVILEIAPKIHIYSGAEENLPERLQKNFAIHDSVSELSKHVYYKILEDLQIDGRQKIYSLIAGGVIIESVYLGVMNVKSYEGNKTLTEKIFEQREFLNNTYDFILTTRADDDILKLLNKLDRLRKCFDQIEVAQTKLQVGEKTDGKIKVEGGNKNIISAKDLEKLKEVAAEVRNEIISEK